MAIRTMFSKLGLAEPGVPARKISAPQWLDADQDRLEVSALDAMSGAGRELSPSEESAPEPARTTPLPVVDKAPAPSLDAPRPVTASNDTATAAEDGPAVVISVLNNDVGVAGVARINGVAVTPGSIITLPSGARVVVNSDGTLSYEVGAAFQGLGAGQTAQDVFTYTAADGGGSPLAPEGVFNASAINGTNGFIITGGAAGDRSGYSVAGIGDVNGDGIADLLIGALSADPTGRTDAGTSYVVYGRQGGFGQTLDLGALTAAQGFAITGVNAFDYSGASVRAAGDVNGDNLADFLIGAPWGEAGQGSNAGETYLVFGRQGGFGAGLDLSTLNGATGVTFRGATAGDGLGFAVSSAGDINGDGFDDLILGAREADGTGEADAGASYVVFGRAGGFTAGIDVAALTGANGFRIIGSDPADRSAWSVAAAGDVNGDGIDDLIIGAPQGDPGGRANAGEAYVVFGRLGGFGASLDLGALSGANGFTISGADAGDHAGWSVSSAGDLNGDGLADLAIGALYADPAGRENAGETYVVFGRQGGFGANLDLSSMSAAVGFTITGTAALNLTGHSVASAGDVNGDGIDDLLIGALYADGAGGTDAGETYVVFGRLGGFGSVLDLSSLNGQTGFAIGGAAAGDYSGHSVAAAGDVNNDGFDDLIIGAPMASPSGRVNAGSSYVLFGAANVTRLSNDATVTVTVTGTNDAPVITSNGGGAVGAYSIVENTLGSSTVTATDPDPGTNLTYSIIGGADAALFAINAAGVLSLINPANFEAPADQNADNVYQVIVQVSDGALTDTQTLNVTVTNANEAPVITSNGGGATGGYIIAENTLGPNSVTAADPDAGANLTYSIIGGADAALFTMNAAGVLSLINPPNFEAPTDQNGDNVYEVIVQVSDGTLTDTQTINLTVTDGNEAPVITSGGGGPSTVVTGVENSTTVTTVVAADPDAGANLVYSVVTGRDGARFAINPATGVLTFVAAPDFEAPTDQNGDNVYEVAVLVSDGLGGEDIQTIFVNVGNANEAPVITSNGGGAVGGYTISENTLGPNAITAADPDAGSNLTYSIIGGADAALFTMNAAGVLSLINAPNFEAPTDQNGDNVYEVIVRASDGSLTDTQTINVTVTNANEAPVITSNGGGATGGYTIFENTFGPNTITAADPDAGANLTYSIIGGADAALFTIDAGGVLRLVSAPDFEAPADQNGDNVYQVIVQTSDGSLTDTQTLSVTVINANEAPVITSNGGGVAGSVNVAENGTGVTTVTAADPDAASNLVYSIAGGADASRFVIDPATGVLAFANPTNFEAPTDQNADNVYDVVVRVSDGTITDTQTLAVTVTNQNEAPVITSNGGGAVGGYTISENTLGPNTVTAADPDAGANLTYSIVGGADAALFTMNAAGVLSLINAPNFEAPTDQNGDNIYEVIVRASDGTLTDTQTINLTVINANEAPAITSDGGGVNATAFVAEGTQAVTTVVAADPDAGAQITYSIVGGVDSGLFTIDPATGAVSFIGTPDFEAPGDQNGDNNYDIVVRASDGTNTDTQNLRITVTDVIEPGPPILTGLTTAVTFAENTVNTTPQLLDANVTFTDSDGDYAGGSLTVSGLLTEDRVSVRNEGSGAGQIGLSGSNVTYGGGVIGVLSGGSGSALTITFNATATAAAIDALIQNLTYANVSDAPTASRVLAINVTDAAGNDLSSPITFTERAGAANPFNGVSVGTDGRSTPTFADLDGDGDLDAVVGEYDGVLNYFENTGTASAPVFTARSGAQNPFDGVDLGRVSTPTFADLDGDGDLDAVVGDLYGRLNYFENTGTAAAPVFIQRTAAANPFNGVSLGFISAPTFVDLDSDGDLDAVVGEEAGNLNYFENTGTAAAAVFAERTGAANPFNGIDVGVLSRPIFADLDGDGDMDAVVGESNGTLLSFENTGTASAPVFTERTGTANPFNGIDVGLFSNPGFADLDGDGDIDVVVGERDGLLNYIENTTARGPTVTVTITAENDAPVITSDGGGVNATVFFAEASRGAVTTVVADDPDAGAAVTYSIAGGPDAGLFTIDPATGVVTFVGIPDFEAPTDQDGDNNYDILVRASDGSSADFQNLRITVTDVTEAGPPILTEFATTASFAENTVNTTPQLLDADVVFVDLDGDLDGGTLTLTGVLAEDRVSVRHQGSGAGQIGRSGSSDITYGGVVIGVLTGGGGGDLTITFNSAATSTAVDALIQNLTYANVSDSPTASRDLTINVTDAAGNDLGATGARAFAERTGSANPLSGVDVGDRSAPTFADLDGDGDLEAVIGEYGGTLLYFENTGTATGPVFTQRTGAANPFDGVYLGNHSRPTLADLDGDGDLDAVVGDAYGTLSYFENTGTTTAPVFTERTGGANPFDGVDLGMDSTPTFADLDGDGDLDAVVGESGGALNYFENTGTATASAFTQRSGSANPFNGFDVGYTSTPGLADVDGDGDLDAVVGEAYGTLSYFENTGTATVPVFTQRTGAANPFNGVDVGYFSAPAFADLDGDGNLDAVVGEYGGALNYFQNIEVRGQTITVNVTPENDGPLLTDVDSPVAINEGDPAVHIDADVTFTDSGVGYGGGNLTVSGLNSTDVVSVFNNGTGPGQIALESGTVSFEGVDFGSVDVTVPGAFIIRFTAAATRAAIEALVEALSYRSTSDIPISTHALFLQITNASSEMSAPATVAIQFTADILNGSAGDDTLSGFRGNDQISGFGGMDTLSGGAGDDRISGGEGDDTLDGGDADDLIDGGAGLDLLTGGDGHDVLTGGADDDSLFGEGGDDQLEGDAGDDILDGGIANDWLVGGSGIDTLRGDEGLDRLEGGDDDDFLYGGNGHDILSGGIGVDDLQGEDGDDQLNGDGGDDRIDGGAGIDTAIFKGPISSYTVAVISAGVVQVTGPEGNDLVLNCEFLQFDDQTINLFGASNTPPRITSDGGGSLTGVDVDEGQTFVTTVVAADTDIADTVTYSIAGGADAARFAINATTGVLTFITAPDFEAPTDVGRDNTYDVIVSASDGSLSDLQGITVTVLDAAGGALPSSKGGGPVICYGPDDDEGGEAGPPQVLPGVFDKAVSPLLPDDLGDMREMPDFFTAQDYAISPLFRLTGAGLMEPPPVTAWDDGFG